MSSRNKRKGTTWESAIVTFLNGRLGTTPADGELFVRRQAQHGVKDIGDLHAVPFCIEAKDEAKHTFSEYIRQANKEAQNSGLPFGVAVVKKRNANVKDGYAVMDLDTFARVLALVRESYGS